MHSMLRFLEAGFVAAARQFVAVIAVTSITVLLASQDFIAPGAWTAGGDPGGFCRVVSPFLGWAFLLTATGLALTRDRSVMATAARIRNASRLINPEHGATGLAVQLVISAILLALFTLRAPPGLLIEILQYFEIACAGSAAWTGMISIGVACLGASAHAAIRAL
jgi:hypothetical protein